MKKKITTLIVAGLLFIPVFSFAETTYERSPEGAVIQNPVNFYATIENIMDIGSCSDNGEFTDYWGISVEGLAQNPQIFATGVASSTLSQNVELNLPVGDYYGVVLWCAEIIEPTNEDIWDAKYVEGTSEYKIFEITSSFLFALPGTSVGSTTGIVSDLINSIGPFVWLVIGIPLGFVVIRKVLRIMP